MENLIKIKEHSFFKGLYSGSGDLELHGSFEGVLKINTLYVKKKEYLLGRYLQKKLL